MRFSTCVGALSLVCLHGASAINIARMRKFSEMAEMGLNPDGSPMDRAPEIMETMMVSEAPPPPPPNETIEAEYVELPLDNFAKHGNYAYEGTFNNRFWVRESAYKPGGPVFIYDVGEADAGDYWKSRLTNDTNFFYQMVSKYNGIGIVWEHRYYGNSTPGGGIIDINTPPDAFKWLTTEQSLADVDRFAKQFKRKNINYTLTPDQTPWVFIGGSYPAMRAAFMRDKYPDTIFASYASSAPTEAKIDMSVYFAPIPRGMSRYGYGNCSKDINAAITYMDKVMEKPDAAAALKKQFLGLGAEKNDNPTFADALSTPFWQWQSYGMEGGSLGLGNFCDWIETDPKTNKTAPADGWAKSKGANFTVQRWSQYKMFTKMVNQYLETSCSGNQSVQGDCNLNKVFSDPAAISWTWQYCTQWGFFQSANLGPNQIISKYNSLTHQKDICHRQWPSAPKDLLPEWPQVEKTNDVFGGWDLRPSQVYWSGGEFDPWRTLSPLSSEPGSPKPRSFTNAPRCGEEQDEGDIFGYVMKDAQHCYDFRTTFPGGAPSRQYFYTALDKWLKCFRPKGKGGKGGRG